MRRANWGDISTLRYGKALPSEDRGLGAVPVYGTNGPTGRFTTESISHGSHIIIGRKGAYRGVHYSPGPSWVIDTAFYLDPTPEISQEWAYYALQCIDINRLDSGSAIPSLSREDFYSLSVEYPPLPEQRAIAEVLGALDDKIAANRKLVTTSLNLVQALHDQLSTTGDVTRTLYTDVAEVGGGATPKTRVPEYWDGDIHWASPTDITALGAPYLHDTSRHITQAGLDSCSSPLYPAGSILMTSRATIGAFAVAQEPAAVNQGFIVLIPKREELRWWLLHEMMGRVKEFQNRANGATFLELSKRTFKTMEFDLPSDTQLLRFDESARALHEHAIALGQESRTLAQLRDTLLPALMDGTIRVKDAEKLTEEAV